MEDNWDRGRERAIEEEEWDGIEEEAVGKGGRKSGIEREIKKVKHHQRYLQWLNLLLIDVNCLVI